MRRGVRFFLRQRRCGCVPCSGSSYLECINFREVISALYQEGDSGWSEAEVNRKQVSGIAVGRVKKTTLESSGAWKEEEGRVHGKIAKSDKTTATVAVFCGDTDGTGGNGGLRFWIGEIIRCGSPNGGKGAQQLVHTATATFKSGALTVTKCSKCVRVRWRRLHKAPAEGLCEYKREGDGGEQWLLLSSILPVEVAVSTTSNASTLKIHSDEIAGIREVAGWVPGQQECKQGGGQLGQLQQTQAQGTGGSKRSTHSTTATDIATGARRSKRQRVGARGGIDNT